jgi:hypothetical protein
LYRISSITEKHVKEGERIRKGHYNESGSLGKESNYVTTTTKKGVPVKMSVSKPASSRLEMDDPPSNWFVILFAPLPPPPPRELPPPREPPR